MPDLQYKQFKPKPASQEVNEKPNRKAYSRVFLVDGDAIALFDNEQLFYRVNISRRNDQWFYWMDKGLSGITERIELGRRRVVIIRRDPFGTEKTEMYFELMTDQTVLLLISQTPGAGLSMMVERAELSAPRLN